MNESRFILSKSKLIEQYNKVKEIADFVSYSLKTNIEVGKILEKETECYFSVHSLNLMKEIKDKKRIHFFGQSWNKETIDCLYNLGIRNFVVDNINDLNVLLENINDKNVNLLLRMRLKERTIHTGKYFVFGMFSKQINEIIPKLKNNKNIKNIGVHFHRKTQNIAEWSLKEEIEQSLTKETLDSIDYINIGGGIPVEYKNTKVNNIDYIFSKIREFREFLKKFNISMIIEPGRFIAAPCIKLETKIKNIYNNNIIVDCSVYNSAMDSFITGTRLIVENEVDKNNGRPYTIKGCTPDSLDILRYRVFLKDPKIGDKIVFLNAGAYNFKTDFFGLEKIPTIIVD